MAELASPHGRPGCGLDELVLSQVIALKDLAERQFASTGRTDNGRVWEWVVDSCTEEFRCWEDDITLIENEDGEEIVHINGEPKARVIVKRQD